jgi:hypothetical protein
MKYKLSDKYYKIEFESVMNLTEDDALSEILKEQVVGRIEI